VLDLSTAAGSPLCYNEAEWAAVTDAFKDDGELGNFAWLTSKVFFLFLARCV
jgi:hypothetical protein